MRRRPEWSDAACDTRLAFFGAMPESVQRRQMMCWLAEERARMKMISEIDPHTGVPKLLPVWATPRKNLSASRGCDCIHTPLSIDTLFLEGELVHLRA